MTQETNQLHDARPTETESGFTEVIGALIRYGVLSVHFGVAVGAAFIFLSCTEGCGAGYGSLIYGVATGFVAALLAGIFLAMRHMTLRASKDRLKREAFWQWIWIGATSFLVMAII